MVKSKLSKIYGVLIIAVPVLIIAAIVYGRVLHIEAHGEKAAHLIINEVVADNLSTLKNESGVYADWIELYNPTDEAISLAGYYLSDSKNELTKWAFPDVIIESDGYLIIFCDNDSGAEYLHTNFMLNSDKETIYLSDINENIIDSLKLRDQQCDISYGRIYGNADEAGFLPYCTPGAANPSYFSVNDEEYADWGEVTFSHDGGLYSESIQVELSCDIEGAAIIYTLDGSEPTADNAYVYSKPIEITDEGRPNQYTTKKCVWSPSENADNADTAYGVNEVYKGTVIRARIVKDAKLSSSVQTNTYFINSDYSLPIVSLSTDPDGLFDDVEGEYVLGYSYYTLRKYGNTSQSTNSYIQRNLEGHIEIYDTDGSIFEDDISFSLSGFSSVESSLQKSFNVILDSKSITGDMFGASETLEYGSFSLRGTGGGVSGDDIKYAYPSAFISNYVSGEGIGAQSSRLCILFIDGEYWGIYSLMEPKGKEYMSERTGVSKKDITLVMTYDGVFDDEFDTLFDEIKSRDFGDAESYEWIKTQIDIENYMACVLAEAFFGNTDGISHGDHNMYIWKEEGGLWKWQVFDFDSTMVDNENYLQKMIEFDYMDSEDEEKKNFTSWLFGRLWESDVFREEFAAYVRAQCEGIYSRESVIAAFEEHISQLTPEIEENLLRCEKDYTTLKKLSFWIRGIETEYMNYTMEDWDITVNDIRRFLSDRTQTILGFLAELGA